MGLFDKIRDNARDLSMKAIEATREYDEDYVAEQQKAEAAPKPSEASTSTEAPTAETAVEETVDFLMEDEATQPKTSVSSEQTEAEDKSDKKEDKPSRRSKVIEVSKTEYEQTQKEKKREEAKQAAKERLAKSYTPSYKDAKATSKIAVDDKDESEDKSDDKPDNKSAAKTEAVKATKPVGIIDITPKKLPDPLKGAIYARERAALTALASQRKLNGTVPLYVAQHMNFKTRVYINRIEYSGSFGKNTLPIDQVAWVKLRHGGTGVIIETTEGKRVVMVVKPADRLAFANAVIKVQAMQPKKGKFRDTQTVRIDQLERFSEGVDELEKLAKLYDKGIISKDEFDAKKKQILGI